MGTSICCRNLQIAGTLCTNTGAVYPGLESLAPAVIPWAGDSTSFGLSLLICKGKIIPLHASSCFCEEQMR